MTPVPAIRSGAVIKTVGTLLAVTSTRFVFTTATEAS